MVCILRTDGVPCIALGSAPVFTASRSRCDMPLCVWLDDVNLCPRMTVKTTRSLLLLIESALQLPADRRLSFDACGVARPMLLPVVAMVRPRTIDAIPRTLHRILAGLDEYEVIFAVHATRCPQSAAVHMHAMIDPAQDALKYGMHPSRHTVVVDADARCIRLQRRSSCLPSKAWEVLAHDVAPPGVLVLSWVEHKNGSCSSEGESLATWWRFETPDGGFLFTPNAAFLTIDMMSRFEPSWWDAV